MNTITLGASNLRVSPIAYGTWQLGGDWGSFDEREVIEAIRFARANGVNFFDTAQAYGFGASERLLGRALREDLDHHRDEVVIATKGGLRLDEDRGRLVRDSSPAWLRQGVEQSLEALGVDHIDLYQVHWPDSSTPYHETAAALAELVQEGKIRHVGVSNFNAGQMAEFARARPVETLQPPYHMFRREIEDEVLPYCREHGIGVLAYGPLAHGLLTGALSQDSEFGEDDWRSQSAAFGGEQLARNLEVVERLKALAQERDCSVSQLAIAWVLAHPAVHVAIVGSRSQAHIEESIGAADVELAPQDLEAIEGILSPAVSTPEAAPEGIR